MTENKANIEELDFSLEGESENIVIPETKVEEISETKTKAKPKAKVKAKETKLAKESEALVEHNQYNGLSGQALLNARILNKDRIVFMHYGKGYDKVRGFVSTISINLIDYSFQVGSKTPVLEEHEGVVRDWLEEAHVTHGTEITQNPDVLAAIEAGQL